MNFKNYMITALILTMIATPVFAGGGGHLDEDLIVGRTDSNQLAVHFDFGAFIELPEISGGFLSGWGIADPGFFNNPTNDAAENFYTLDASADVRFEVISFDDAFRGWTQGFASTFHDPGEFFELGSPDFDEHPFWQIDSTDVGFDPLQTQWQATGRLVDVGLTGYAPSEAFTLTFVPVPEPATLAFAVLPVALLVRRRRRAL